MKGRRAYEFSSDVFPGMSECKLLQDTGEHRNRSSDTSDRASGGNTYRIDPVFTALIAVVKAIPVNLIILIAGLWFNDNFNGIARAFGLSVTVADVDKIYVAIWALSIAAIALLSESVRGALLSVDHGQYEAGYAVGLTGFQTFTRIIMPQAFLVLVPALIGNINSLIKLSALVILVGVQDVLNAGIKVASIYYCYLEAYVAAALIYWAISIICIQAGKLAEKELGRYRRSGI